TDPADPPGARPTRYGPTCRTTGRPAARREPFARHPTGTRLAGRQLARCDLPPADRRKLGRPACSPADCPPVTDLSPGHSCRHQDLVRRSVAAAEQPVPGVDDLGTVDGEPAEDLSGERDRL